MGNKEYLLTHDFTTAEINGFLDDGHEDFESLVVAIWKEDGIKVIEEIGEIPAFNLTFKEFLNHCTACGGDWGAMFLTGIKELASRVYDAIPDNMGTFAFTGIIAVLNLMGISTAE